MWTRVYLAYFVGTGPSGTTQSYICPFLPTALHSGVRVSIIHFSLYSSHSKLRDQTEMRKDWGKYLPKAMASLPSGLAPCLAAPKNVGKCLSAIDSKGMKKRRGNPGSFSQSRGQFSTPRFHIPNACPREKRTKKLVRVITSAAKPRPPSGLWKDRSQAEPPDKYWKGDLIRHKKCYSRCLISSTALSLIQPETPFPSICSTSVASSETDHFFNFVSCYGSFF